MKKTFLLMLAGVMAFSMIACGGTDQEADEQQNQEQVSEEKTGIAAVVDNLYHSNYEYEKTQTTMLGEEEIQVMYQGAYIASPYQEHVKVIEAPDEADWTEAYSSGDGETVESTFRTADGLMTQESERSYPYGYGENLEFTLDREETLDGVLCDVYRTEYTRQVQDGFRKVDAAVKQEYYIDREKQQVAMIYTDLSEVQEGSTETLRIYNYNGDITIEPLS